MLTATGERDMDRLGGLIHRMPQTAFLFLVGCMAISALPPLNGFVSEWLTFQAILQSPELPQWGLKIMVPAVGGLLALSAALAGACFVKAFGITFLGRPRSKAAETASEVDRFSLAAMAGLAVLCLAAGILPGFVIDALSPVTARSWAARCRPSRHCLAHHRAVGASGSSYNGLLVFLFIADLRAHRHLGHSPLRLARLRRAPAWDCGFPEASPLTQYSRQRASPSRSAGCLWRASSAPRKPSSCRAPGDMRPARFSLTIHDPIWERLYRPIAGAIVFIADHLNRLQFLTIRRYLALSSSRSSRCFWCWRIWS